MRDTATYHQTMGYASRSLFITTIVTATLSFVPTASPSLSADRDVARTVRSGLVELRFAYADMNTCHGCPEQAAVAQQVTMKWMKALNKTRPSTSRGVSGFRAAFEGFRYYGYAALNAGRSWFDAQNGLVESDYYNVYVQQHKRAQAYMTTAKRLLQIHAVVIP